MYMKKLLEQKCVDQSFQMSLHMKLYLIINLRESKIKTKKSYYCLGIKIARHKNEQVRKCHTDLRTREG